MHHKHLWTYQGQEELCVNVAGKNVRSPSHVVERPTGMTKCTLVQLNGGVSPFCDVVVAATTTMAKITEDGQRSDESKESVIQTHGGLLDS